MAYINHEQNPAHEPQIGDSFFELYPWSEVPVALGWNKVQDLEEDQALQMALAKVPRAVVTCAGQTVAAVARSNSPGVGWSNRIIVVAYETPTYLFAIGQVDRQWELFARKKDNRAAQRAAREKFNREVDVLENELYESCPINGPWRSRK